MNMTFQPNEAFDAADHMTVPAPWQVVLNAFRDWYEREAQRLHSGQMDTDDIALAAWCGACEWKDHVGRHWKK